METTSTEECVPGCGYTYQLVPDGTSVSDAECDSALKAARRSQLKARGLGWHGVSALFHAACLFAASAFMSPLSLSDDSMPSSEQVMLMSQLLSAQAERELEPQPNAHKHDGAAVNASAQNSGSKTGSGRASSSTAHGPAQNDGAGASGLAGTRSAALADAASFGMINVLAQTGANAASPWGTPDSITARMGDMWLSAETHGSGALELSGAGESGGPGVGLSLGTVRTVGRDGDFGSNRRVSVRGHAATAPKMRPGAPTVGGRLPSDLVQRTVRQSFGRFRACYEAGLRSNPNLAGRVAVRFVIGRDGSVMSAANGGSDLPDAGVVSCVVNSFRGLSFPAPPDGIVTVTYPIVFSPQ